MQDKEDEFYDEVAFVTTVDAALFIIRDIRIVLACFYHLCEHLLVSSTYSKGGKGSVHRTETISVKPAERR